MNARTLLRRAERGLKRALWKLRGIKGRTKTYRRSPEFKRLQRGAQEQGRGFHKAGTRLQGSMRFTRTGRRQGAIEWSEGNKSLDAMIDRLQMGAGLLQDNVAMAVAEHWAPRIESYMKLNAPWTDRTGNARNGLAARAYRDGDEVGIVLYHQVPYGIWLETRWDGQYGIIRRTLEDMGPEVMRSASRILDRM